MLLPQIDPIDQEIIRLLHDNGRMSYAKIGETLNLSRVAIQKRVEGLIADGIIENFTVRLNSARLGKYISAFFEVRVEPRFVEQAGNALAEEPEVISIYQMTGPSTLHMHALLKDEEALETFLFQKIYTLEGVVNVDTHMVIKRFKQGTGLEL
ncbi:Lrp/AsnC family transcriptional regulator [Paenibacillus mucilaginosus]|uniref:Transcriptional regulator n=2 Tax=Paenibacillus mucilaginosus TaxID=61624 RepID=H6NTT9_9BACL|nr:Lrp/AsnC family transcriptional regulator [Paenibacillus mucilaginosus]AEI39414.1 transcriptional regulator [Paenibacillus mucilaginosus KNP414]AFC27683.1 transcriptional regulator [Paenibacillus mucilaginosus 3016]MCG7214748.1 Lrp/AsnC family transcriptional regulator [Paenibacillus mucilaginosus]WDM28394.1 Lrp/AsnC family transcriptional regulator [Paenibacillus mucilaginosus]WFA16566.1 Lrp/AsnC family transcriptional regulator [Paenibacillus mucilaginosus]